jgi:hypothetical protein
MGNTPPDRESGPEIALSQLAAEPNGETGYWSIDWLVENRAAHPLQVLAVRLPHGQFRCKERAFEPPLDFKVGEKREIHTLVGCDEPPSMVTENAFAIFDVLWLDEPWRIFVRLRVVVNSAGKPKAAIESITTQKVGFSGVSS